MAARRKPAVPDSPAPPPRHETAWVPVYSAQSQGQIDLVALNDSLTGFYTHFHLNRTMPCIGRESGCVCGQLALARRWKGYLGCWCPHSCRCVIAEVTAEAYRCGESYLNGSLPLRGCKVVLFRLGGRLNAPVRVLVGGRLPDNDVALLPPPVDVQLHLYRLWGLPLE